MTESIKCSCALRRCKGNNKFRKTKHAADFFVSHVVRRRMRGYLSGGVQIILWSAPAFDPAPEAYGSVRQGNVFPFGSLAAGSVARGGRQVLYGVKGRHILFYMGAERVLWGERPVFSMKSSNFVRIMRRRMRANWLQRL